MPEEQLLLKMLNSLKNKRISKYDFAYKELNLRQQKDSERFVKQVRQTFLEVLKPFLKDVQKCIDTSRDADSSQTVFEKYFDSHKYLGMFEGEAGQDFACRLLNSTQFQSFCDDYFSVDQHTNFQLFFNIIGTNPAPEDQPVTFEFRMPKGAQQIMIFDRLLSVADQPTCEFIQSLRQLY